MRESSKETDYAKADKFLKHRLKEVGADLIGIKKFIGPAEQRITVSELLDSLKVDYEIREKWNPRVGSHVKALKDGIGHFRAVELNKKFVQSYMRQRQALKRANATINNELQLLRQAYKISEAVGDGPKVRRLPENNAREGFFEKAEIETLIGKLPEDLQDFTRFGYLVGWRKGEIASLRWSELDTEGRTLNLRHTESKNREARKIPLEGELWALIERRSKARSYQGKQGEVIMSEYVFHRRGQPVGDFEKSWKTACEKANLTGKLFHDLRRTAARNLVRAGVPEQIAMLITGHKTTSMFRRYNITNDDDVKRGMRMMLGYLSTIPAEKQNVLQFPKVSGSDLT